MTEDGIHESAQAPAYALSVLARGAVQLGAAGLYSAFPWWGRGMDLESALRVAFVVLALLGLRSSFERAKARRRSRRAPR